MSSDGLARCFVTLEIFGNDTRRQIGNPFRTEEPPQRLEVIQIIGENVGCGVECQAVQVEADARRGCFAAPGAVHGLKNDVGDMLQTADERPQNVRGFVVAVISKPEIGFEFPGFPVSLNKADNGSKPTPS